MSRSDANLLMTDSIREMLDESSRREKRDADEQRHALELKKARQLTHCSHCKTRLSDIDHKMGSCLACNKSLVASSSPSKVELEPVLVRI